MPYIPPEVVEKAREMDLLTYLKNYEPLNLVDSLMNHSSLLKSLNSSFFYYGKLHIYLHSRSIIVVWGLTFLKAAAII